MSVKNNSINNVQFSRVVVQTFYPAGSYTYTPTAGMIYCIVEVSGAGGAGGGVPSTGLAQIALSTGGAGGTYCKSLYSAATIGSSQSLVVGAGGVGVSNANGGAGGNSTFGSLITAGGGGGGDVGGAFATSLSGVSPGNDSFPAASSGANILSVTGQIATAAFYVTGLAQGGFGGTSFFSPQATCSTVYFNSLNASFNSGYGAGGGGTGVGSPQSKSAFAGSNGADGIIIVTEYCN